NGGAVFGVYRRTEVGKDNRSSPSVDGGAGLGLHHIAGFGGVSLVVVDNLRNLDRRRACRRLRLGGRRGRRGLRRAGRGQRRAGRGSGCGEPVCGGERPSVPPESGTIMQPLLNAVRSAIAMARRCCKFMTLFLGTSSAGGSVPPGVRRPRNADFLPSAQGASNPKRPHTRFPALRLRARTGSAHSGGLPSHGGCGAGALPQTAFPPPALPGEVGALDEGLSGSELVILASRDGELVRLQQLGDFVGRLLLPDDHIDD